MSFVGDILSAPLKALGLVSTPGKPPAPLPTVTRDDAIVAAQSADELRRRKGAAADIVTGTGGAEAAPTGGKLTLGS